MVVDIIRNLESSNFVLGGYHGIIIFQVCHVVTDEKRERERERERVNGFQCSKYAIILREIRIARMIEDFLVFLQTIRYE